jgi:sugar/nucleoside kinase (ribokinase family)
MFDIITFGSATWDISLTLSGKKVKDNADLIVDKGIYLNLGSKISVQDMYFGFGGGGLNTSVTFKKQGFRVAYCGSIGDDIPGKEIIEYLRKTGIDDSFVKKVKKPTNNSVILHIPSKDRTILVYRGASEMLKRPDIQWEKLKSPWFYLAPLSGKLSALTEDIVNFAKKNDIKVLANLGNSQILMAKSKLRNVLDKVDILLLNKEEASLLTGIDYKKEKEIIFKTNEMHKGLNVITKGEEGVVVSDGKKVYEAKLKKFKIKDATGAGDSFGSGFVSGLIKSKYDIEYAIKLGLTNSKHCLLEQGSTNGLLEADDDNLVDKENIRVHQRPCQIK